tara:strand:+ start:18191 stop:19846 length:1656 start_codon:yes stop_codon:yes gene_type:complete
MSKISKILSLKYRPQNFNDLIGQEVIAKTIYNSIKLKKIPNAYLFTGIRGVGKTTIARIVAKALNCKNGVDKLCSDNFCDSCDSIINSNHIDVLEMDAASKTGVDDVRDLIEFSRYSPSIAKYKIFIIDEVHMLSKQAFNALLKTLEEPPEYLKFIFATTEIKKIPITVISRCQRFDLSRIKSEELLKFLQKICKLEKREADEDALKLIVKISEGSVRDSLSLLDRALISESEKKLTLKTAQKIFGYYDKSSLIKIFEYLFEGNEEEVLKTYRSIYESGVEPKIFLNDFLELLYYFKNIESINLGGNNFSLNDKEYDQILNISKNISPNIFMIFWQFAIKSMNELEVVSNQNISVEMFLLRLLYLKNIKEETSRDYHNEDIKNQENQIKTKILTSSEDNLTFKNKTVSQIKNIFQEDELQISKKKDFSEEKIRIKDFESLISLCAEKKELKLKYELETNVNLVSFDEKRIEISFNEKLDKNFVKDLSQKLYEWTLQRWIITFSKKHGMLTKKQTSEKDKINIIESLKSSNEFKKITEILSDAELIDVKKEK